MIKRAVLYAALALSVLVMAGADSSWEGSAVIGRHGAFPAEGFYGASNSFARNSVVEVTNLETGRSVEVIIVTRVREPGVFLSLSDEAGEELGLDRSAPARVRVTPVETRVVTPPTVIGDRPLSLDPDLNPLAQLEHPDGPYLLPLPAEDPTEPDVEPVPVAAPPGRGVATGVVRSAAVVPSARTASGDEVGRVDAPRRLPQQAPPAIDPQLREQPFFTPPAEVAETNRMEEAVAALRGRVPPKELHPPPRDDEVFTFLDVPRELAVSRPIEHSLAEAPLPDERAPRIAERPAAEALGRIEQPRPPLMIERPPEIAAEPDPAPPADDNGVILRLEPAVEPAPRVTVDEWALESLPLQAELEESSYYLQVGAFASPRSARNVIDRMQPEYPFAVTAADQNDRTLYRVFVGPLSQDETGVVLYQLRASGYRDAFIRRGGA